MNKKRFESITDAILAIIITLMALEIKLPDLTYHSICHFCFQVSVYLIGSVFIANLWLNHHNMFHYLTDIVPMRIIWINFGLLFITSMIPLATKTLSENFFNVRSHVFFGGAFTIGSILYAILEDMVYSHSNHKYNKSNRRMNWVVTGFYISSTLLCFMSVYLSAFCFTIIPITYLLLPKKFRGHQQTPTK